MIQMNPQQMMQMLGPQAGAMAAPMGPLAGQPLPGIMSAGGQGVGAPALNAQQILAIMAQPKLQGRVR